MVCVWPALTSVGVLWWGNKKQLLSSMYLNRTNPFRLYWFSTLDLSWARNMSGEVFTHLFESISFGTSISEKFPAGSASRSGRVLLSSFSNYLPTFSCPLTTSINDILCLPNNFFLFISSWMISASCHKNAASVSNKCVDPWLGPSGLSRQCWTLLLQVTRSGAIRGRAWRIFFIQNSK